MNKKLKVLQISAYATALLWLTSGVLTIGSIYLSTIGAFINITVGSIFLIIAVFYMEKQKRLYFLLNQTCKKDPTVLCQKVISLELLSMGIAIFLGLIVVYAITHRIFYEGFAVFG